MQVRFISNITKEYPDMFKIVVYKEPRVFIKTDAVKRPKEIVQETYNPEVSSLRRTKTLISDIILCNDFDLFCTFTFDPHRVNRYSYVSCNAKFTRWVHHQKEHSPNLCYLAVPEQHKDGAWHFHVLMKNFNGSMKDSKHKSSTGRAIYNITAYRSGFSTAVKIDNKEAVAHYVQKYITKDFVRTFNRRRFTCSRNLVRPVKTTNSQILSLTLPLFRTKTFETMDFDLYTVPKF